MFPETVWSQILRAKNGGTAANDVFARYRAPILRFIQASGYPDADADDLTQEVLLRLYTDDLLAKADRARGRFRSFLLGVTKNVLRERGRAAHAEKRGGDRVQLSLDAPVGGDRSTAWVDAIPAEEPDEGFDRLWIEALVKEALGRLRDECARRGQPHYEVLRMEVEEGVTHAQAAERTGQSVENVRAIVSRARKRLGELLASLIREYSSSPAEADDELAYLWRFVAPQP